jgi:predicted transcriptional regulator of viral defense system
LKKEKHYNYLLSYVESLQSRGRYTFSLEQVRTEFKHMGDWAIQIGLSRLSKKNKIVSVHRGFYVIVPPEYSTMGVQPAILFIDQLMTYLGKPYYVSVLSAAALQGAAHQQPQEFFVMTDLPVLRSKKIKRLKINFLSKLKISEDGIISKKTESGYVKVSGPELTALDIVMFENRIGGLNRVATLLDELLDEVDPEKLKALLKKDVPIAIVQRLGYISDKILGKKKIASMIHDRIKNKKLLRVPLSPREKRSGFPVDADWKIIINAEPESDL